ncbi:uncharacterized protein LOC114738903, partial [Neltuma alba]|uniref:uncharacterized protein LOC114738903 n=1 Tax=Neltuma alba TaxID=207710 RepID=UPI0010A3D7DE
INALHSELRKQMVGGRTEGPLNVPRLSSHHIVSFFMPVKSNGLDEADVFKETKQLHIKDGSQFVFMDLNTFEEIRLSESEVGDRKKWLKEGMDCNLLLWNGKVIDLELPITVKLSVVDVDPGLKGDTAQGGSKPATLDTGAVVNVPLFINRGDEILVDTRTGST